MVVEVVLKILAIISGEYGKRHVANIQKHGPDDWEIEAWQAPAILPPVIDYPEDYLPEQMPAADLILSFAEHKGVAELLPDIAGMTGAQAVLVAVDNEAWLPRGLARQLKGWLSAMQVACATPKPLCTLTESDYKITRRKRETYTSPLISEFARYFGQPDLKITVDPETRTISAAQVRRDAVCGCIRYVAEKLVGVPVDEAEEKAGLLHHHYPCLASMVKLDDYNHDTLMHESGHMLRDNINEQIKPFKDTQYIAPRERSE
jgi:thymidylate synthase